ncbi:MAG TPA: four helix bundle protein [Pyrinomonadaceae bacterium]|jgi:four helix bundle protein|nr:four helix bundle protein [Pyrinomonadaceae bacterium]
MKIKSFRDLRVWQLAMELVERVYRLTRDFPRHEVYGLSSQIQRAAVSIPSNLAEGHTREHTKEFLHHLSMAQASLAELETQLEIAARLNYVSRNELNPLTELAISLGKQQYALRNSLLKKLRA